MVTVEERVERALLVGNRWIKNLEANEVDARAMGQRAAATKCKARAGDIRDLLAILSGDEDAYIAALNEKEDPHV